MVSGLNYLKTPKAPTLPSPKAPRSQAMPSDNLPIRWNQTATSIGTLAVAASERGVVCVVLQPTPKLQSGSRTIADVETQLAKRLASAILHRVEGDAQLNDWLGLIVRAVESPPVDLSSVPLDADGTDFQHKVWDALMQIGSGETLTYGEVAKRIGKSGGAQAVGAACGANPTPFLVPCHRVLAAGNRLNDFYYGVGIKDTLLRREAQDKTTSLAA